MGGSCVCVGGGELIDIDKTCLLERKQIGTVKKIQMIDNPKLNMDIPRRKPNNSTPNNAMPTDKPISRLNKN